MSKLVPVMTRLVKSAYCQVSIKSNEGKLFLTVGLSMRTNEQQCLLMKPVLTGRLELRDSSDMPFDSACAFAGVKPLSVRRYELWRRFFRSITQSDSCLHDLLRQRRDSEILSRLRKHTVYPIPLAKTKKISLFSSLCSG